MPPPNPLWLFHITAIPNLASIAALGEFYSTTRLAQCGQGHANIAYQGAQGRRAAKVVQRPPGGVIHDYVPFYFAPRSPMLFTINNRNVPGCPYRQEDIVHFMTSADLILRQGLLYVFYDYNATLDIATCFNQLDELGNIDWSIFFETPRVDGYCRYWHSVHNTPRYMLRMETRQAEFLVHWSVPLSVFVGVGTYNDAKAAEVRGIFNAAGLNLPVKAKPGWYY